MDIVEDVNIDDLVAELESRNSPVCYRAAFVIKNLRGKKTVVAAPEPEVPAVEETPVPAPATLADAASGQDA